MTKTFTNMYTYPTCSGIVKYTKFNNPIIYCLEPIVNPILFIKRDYVKKIKKILMD